MFTRSTGTCPFMIVNLAITAVVFVITTPLIFSAGPIEFIEADLSTLPPLSATPDPEKGEIPMLEKPKKEGTGGGDSCLFTFLSSST